MRSRTKFSDLLIWLMVCASLGLMLYNAWKLYRPLHRTSAAREPDVDIATGVKLVPMKFNTLAGDGFVLPEKGKYLISLLSTGCEACHDYVGELNRQARRQAFDGVIGVFFERYSNVNEFASTYKPQFTCVVEHTGEMVKEFGIRSYPQTLILEDGLVKKSWVGIKEITE